MAIRIHYQLEKHACQILSYFWNELCIQRWKYAADVGGRSAFTLWLETGRGLLQISECETRVTID